MQTAYDFVTLDNDGSVASILLRRPPLNIMNLDMIRELNRTLRDLRMESGLRALVLRAEGKTFSAGVAVEDHVPEKVRGMLGAFHEVFRQLRVLSCPVVAAVQGPALGGGCELACFADWVIASEAATFGLPEIKLGSFPPVAAAYFPHRIGLARAVQLILSGDVLPAAEAQRIGLADRVVAADQLEAGVETVVATLRDKSAPVLRLAKRAAFAALGREFEAGLGDAERLFLEQLMETEDAAEGPRAFLQKRPAVWKQR